MNLAFFLLAQADGDSMQRLQQAFRNQRPGEVSPFITTGQFFVVMVVVVTALYVVIRLTQRRNMPAAAKNPRRFFAQILKHLGAGPLDRMMLQRAARHAALEQPAMMLISAELLEKYAGAWADSISFPPLRDHVRHRIARVGAMAFARI